MQRAHATGAQRSLRPFPSPLRTGIRYLFFALVLGAASARIVGDSSDEVRYAPTDPASTLFRCATDINDNCANKWFSETMSNSYLGAVHSTQGPTASLQLNFRGSIIVVKGVTDDRGARAFMRIDNSSAVTIDTKSGDGQRHPSSILHSFSGLDPFVDHQLTIEYDSSSAGRRRPRLLRIDSFEIDEAVEATVAGVPSESEFPTVQQPPPPAETINTFPPPATTNTFPTAPSPTSGNGASTSSDPQVVAGTTSNSSTVPIVAGLATGLATLVIASAVIWFLLRRRRAVRIQSMELPRSTMSPPAAQTRSPPPRMVGLANLAYAFNRRGSSVGSSADGPPQLPAPTQPMPPVPPPRINTYVSPYNYQRRGPAYPMSDATSSIGLPVDERPPNIPAARGPASPVAQSPRVLRVHNPGSSVVSSNA